MTRSRLSEFQRELLEAFFERTDGFFLTGGAALAGFHLGHRTTEDLDLFTTKDRTEEGSESLRSAAAAIGATVEPLRTSPTFRRSLVRRGNEGVVVDLVLDSTAQFHEQKLERGRIRLDPPEEILANKLCALLSRSELRDLVEVLELEWSGHDIGRALAGAMRKDSDLSPGQLAWVLSGIRIGDDARVPGDRSPEELRAYLVDLRARLARMAMPR